MSTIYRNKYFDEFVEYNRDYINQNIVMNIFLIKAIDQVYLNPDLLFDFFNINKNRQMIIVLLIRDFCLIYGDLDDDEAIELLAKELNFEKFNRYSFAGTRNIVHKLLDYTKSEYSEVKHLSIYKCNNVNSIDYDITKIELFKLNDLQYLYLLMKDFHIEFYEGYSEDILPNIEDLKQSINEGTYFKYVEDNVIKAFGNLKYDYGFPELSLVFTKKEYRGNNIGTYLSHFLTTKGLLDYEFIMLYTKGSNKSAKRVFEKIGYFNDGEYTMFYKEI